MNVTVNAEARGRVLGIEPDTELPEEAGGKAHGLRLIAQTHLPLPRSWVVLPGEDDGDLASLVSALERHDLTSMAVRSSARDEDDHRFSFAGIHESVLGVTREQLPQAVNTVAQSPLSDRARAYRNQIGLPQADGPCAVVVQELIHSESAGIAFGLGDENDRVVIEAVEGLGETAVDGQATPETIVVRRAKEGWLVEHRRSRFQKVLAGVSEGGISRMPVPPARRRAPVLTDERAREIATGVTELQQAAGRRLDVEWAGDRNQVWFLQARPQTRPIEETIPPGQVWTRANAREVLPDIPSAFTRSTIPRWLDRAQRDLLRIHGLHVDPSVPLFTFILGRPVFNDAVFLIGDMLGVPRASMEADLGGTSTSDDSFQPWSTIAALRHPMVLIRAVVNSAGAERHATRFISEIREVRAQLAAVDAEALSDREIVEMFASPDAEQLGNMARHAIAVAGLLARAQYFALDTMKQLPFPRSRLAQLVGEGEPTVSTRQLEDLLELALTMRQWSGGREFLEPVTSSHRAPETWKQNLPSGVWSAVDRWIEQYGHRGPYESDLAQPRFIDDLSLLARALSPLVRGESAPESAAQRAQRRRWDAAMAWEEITARLGRLKAWWLRRLVRDVKRLTRLREELRGETMQSFVHLRRMGLELGRRLFEQGRLEDPEDIWHLTLGEIERAVSDPGFDSGIAVARELSRLSAWRPIHVPNRFTSEDVPGLATRVPVGDRISVTFNGNGISPGIVEGEVRVLQSPTDGDLFVNGAVLVAPATDPSWTPIFARAVGVVVEIGGTLSHAGIVAREFGIPCVANIEDVTRHLHDGDIVRVDGSRGTVTVGSRADDARGSGEFLDGASNGDPR